MRASGGFVLMKRLYRLMAVGVLAVALTLTACGGKQQKQGTKQEQGGGGGGSEKKTGTGSKKKQNGGSEKKKGGGGGKEQEDPIEAGAGKMQTKLEDLRDALKSSSPPDVTQEARALDDQWESFEREVEKKNPQQYDRVERALNRVLVGAQLIPVDNAAIRTEIDNLEQEIATLKETKGAKQEPKKVDMKTGSAAMRHNLNELRTAVKAGDEAAMRDKAKAVDTSWTQFEGEVKEKSMEDYAAVEDPLHAIWNQVENRPIDQAELNKKIDELDAKLAELSK
jgi:iron uptake system EfeUOB component EfeO/EfeM